MPQTLYRYPASDHNTLSLSHLPRAPCISPLPQLPSNSHFFSKNGEQRGSRPEPPTPGRAMMSGYSFDDHAGPQSRQQRLSTSSIPRPASGTSRRAITTRQTDRISPVSVSVSSPDTASKTLGCLKKYNYIDNTFSGSTTKRSARTDLPISQTIPALLSPNRDVRSHSLLRPLPPSVPRSVTYYDFASFECNKTSSNQVFEFESPGSVIPRSLRRYPVRRSPYPINQKTIRCSMSSNISIKTTSATSSVISQTVIVDDEPVLGLEIEPRNVFNAEPTQYWVGRFTALQDRLRSKELRCRLKLDGTSRYPSLHKPRSSRDLARAEAKMRQEILQLLRSLCKTKNAIDSFDVFERLLHRKFKDRSDSISVLSYEASAEASVEDVDQSSTTRAIYPSVSKMRKFSDTLPSSIFRKPSSLTQRKIEKSLTVANLVDGKSVKGSHVNCNSTCRTDSQLRARLNRTAAQAHISKSQSSDGKRLDASRIFSEPIPRKPRHSLVAQLIQSGPDVQDLPKNSAQPPERSNLMMKPALKDSATPCLIRVQQGKIGDVSADLGSPNEDPDDIRRQEEDNEDRSSGQPRRFRKSESMKRLVDAGMKEIKKMGRRVSNSNDNNGTDDC